MLWEGVRIMSNSSLVTYKHICRHYDKGREGRKISKIFVHHMAGNLTVKQCGNVFDNRPASAHYGVNGKAIGLYVNEGDTAWHCGNWGWNTRSIGIELANDGGANWHVSDTTIATAIKLIADICQRNGIKKLNYTGDMNGNLCMHKWVCSTSCPGPYLSTRFNYIAKEVNKILKNGGVPVYEPLEIDGEAGELTISAVQRFLKVEEDGELSGQVKSQDKFRPNIFAVAYGGEGSLTVEALQKWLGFKKKDVTGKWGEKVSKEFQAYLKKEGYYKDKVDGVFGPVSVKAMQNFLNKMLFNK